MSLHPDSKTLTPRFERAVGRLTEVISLNHILEYAKGLHDPQELKFIKTMISDLSLRYQCRKADVAECIRYVDSLIEACYRPLIIEQHNSGCFQNYGPISDSEFYSNNSINHRKR